MHGGLEAPSKRPAVSLGRLVSAVCLWAQQRLLMLHVPGHDGVYDLTMVIGQNHACSSTRSACRARALRSTSIRCAWA